MMSKNWEIHPLRFKEASNVFRSGQKYDSRHNEVIFHAEARWLFQRKSARACVSTGVRVAGFLAQQGYPYPQNFKAIFGFIWIRILCHGSCSHLHVRKLTWVFRM